MSVRAAFAFGDWPPATPNGPIDATINGAPMHSDGTVGVPARRP